MSEYVHYVFVRKDLPLGVAAAMITHAAGESGALFSNSSLGLLPYVTGLPKHTVAVVLAAENERNLEQILSYLHSQDLKIVPIHEHGGEYAGQLMAIGVVPCERDKVYRKLQHFYTLRELDK